MWDPEYVLILSGDHIYKMDYTKMLEAHKQAGAACTIAVIQVSMDEARRFGIMSTGPDGSISEFEEKPAHPKSDLASMGIYKFLRWRKLRKALFEDEADPASSKDFGKNIIPRMLASGQKLWPYRFDGYWRDVGTITSLWDANMDMLSPELINLYDPSWPILSRSPIRPPHLAGAASDIRHSIVTEGCVVEGSVFNSVLSNSVTVAQGAAVEYSVLMPGAVVEEDAQVRFAILGENAHVCAGARVGSEPDGTAGWDVATVGPGLTVGAGAVVAPGAMLYKDVRL
jgi:glucose-1-phosphate adenylyltransferase